jgi:hypothetical protein
LAWPNCDGKKEGEMQVVMKSIKYIIITAIFLVASSQASYMYESRWPGHWVRDWVEETQQGQSLNQIPVCIDVPMFVQVLNVKDLEIFLDAVDAGIYEGCTDFQVLSNLDIVLGCKLVLNGKVLGDYSCWIDDTYVQATGDAPATRKACVKLENPEYYYFATSEAGVDVEVAKLIVTVAPR